MSRYQCRICGVGADEKKHLINHVDTEHDTVTWFVEAAIDKVE